MVTKDVREKPGIFDGIGVLDFSIPIQEPYLTRLMADMEAEIIKVERPGVMARLGVDYPKLREVNSRIIMCSLPGFGQYGPYVDRPAGNTLIQAFTRVWK